MIPCAPAQLTRSTWEAQAVLLGKDAPNLPPAVISKLIAEWQGEYERGPYAPAAIVADAKKKSEPKNPPKDTPPK